MLYKSKMKKITIMKSAHSKKIKYINHKTKNKVLVMNYCMEKYFGNTIYKKKIARLGFIHIKQGKKNFNEFPTI